MNGLVDAVANVARPDRVKMMHHPDGPVRVHRDRTAVSAGSTVAVTRD